MPRNKPTTKLDVVGNLELRPENAVGNLIESKQQGAYFIKPPQWDSAGDSIELMAIRNEREYLDMMKTQKEMIENAKRQRIINHNRIEELYKTQKELRERFIHVNIFIQDCEAKRNAAEKKVIDEKRTQSILTKDIEKYTNDIQELTEFSETLRATVKEFEPYETVIEDVVKESDILNTVKDCMDRCDGLMLAQVEIIEMEQEKLKAIEEIRHKIVKATNDAALTVLGLNNELAELERSYNNARSETFRWEKIMATTKDCIADNELTRGRLLDAVHHMYRLLCKRRNVEATIHFLAIEEKMDFIKEEMEILQSVCKIVKNKVRKSSVTIQSSK